MNFMDNTDDCPGARGRGLASDLAAVRKQEWHLQFGTFSLHFEVCDGNILHGIAAGRFKGDHIEPGFRLKNKVINTMGLDSTPYFCVMGLTGIDGAGQKARKGYVKALIQLYRKHPFSILIFYGANKLVTAAINMSKPFVPFKVRVVKDFDDAVKLITNEKVKAFTPSVVPPTGNQSNQTEGADQIQNYVEELLGYIEQINWDVDGIHQIEDKAPDHPFRSVFEAIKLIKWELDDLYQQRQSVEQALRKSEDKFRKIVEASPMGMHMYRSEPDGRLVFTGANPAADTILGVDNRQFVGKTIEEAFPSLEKTEVPDRYRQVCDTGAQYRNEHLEYTDGRVQGAFEFHAFQTGPGMMATMFFDVTARKRAEAALRQSEERYKTLTNNLHVGIYRNTAGLHGRFIEANPAIVEMFGYQSRDEFKAVNVADLYQNPDDRKKFNDIMLKHGSVKKFEVKLTKKDGTLFTGAVSAVVVKDANGKVKHYDGIIEDITGKKELELQLQQAQKMEAIGTLAGGIAHDFNNILSAILGYAELALMDAERESALCQNLQEVFRAGERAKDLVNQILTFSRQAERESKPIQMNLVSKEVIKFLRASLPTTIEIRQENVSDSLVMADATHIHQLLMNLCINAGYAMREKGGVLEVKLKDVRIEEDGANEHPELNPGSYLELTISDTGDGIPALILDRIFDPFFTTKEKGEGTGMGLSVVHGIVGSYGGKIIVSSEPGKGSTFTVYLPTVERDQAPYAFGNKSIPTGSERILFVDDESAIVNIGKQMLESLGYHTTVRTSSLEALELFKAKADSFDLVITDMTMPNMTGDELARELMRIKPGIPVILCTGYSARINQQKARAMGIRALVSKPVLRKDIAETIRRILHK